MCSNQASVPNSLPSLYMIDWFTSFRPASMDEILLKTAFCTENQCPGMPEQCPNVPGHARTMPEAPRTCPGRARTMPARVSNDLWGSLYPSVDKLPQRSFNRGRLIPVAVRVVVCLDINAQTLDLAFLVRGIISRMIQHRLRRIRTGARRQLLPPKPLL